MRKRSVLTAVCVGTLLQLSVGVSSHATETPVEPQVGLAIGGAALVALAAGLQTMRLLDGSSDSHVCNTWGCNGTEAASAFVEPLGASLLLAWAWQLGQKHEVVARTKGDTQDYRAVRGVAAIVGLSSSLTKTFLFGYNLWLKQKCSGRDDPDCPRQRLYNNDVISFALTPTLIIGALAAGYAVGYESGKPKGLTAITFVPVVVRGGSGMGLQVRF